MDAVRVGLIGISGYGGSYLRGLLDDPRGAPSRLVAVADPGFQNCSRLAELRDRKVAIFPSTAEMFAAGSLDLAIICSPIQFHARQVRESVQAGANVLCEKPLAGSLADARQMLADSQSTDRFVAVGFQWSFTSAIQGIKRDIREGVLGKPIRLRSYCVYPRGYDYYGRNAWVGRKETPTGPVLDSPVNNATAHFLHNMFFVLGETASTSQMPISVQAETYRANEIENFDTAALRCVMPQGVEVLFYTSHAIPNRVGPNCTFEFENAVVSNTWDSDGKFIARFRDGKTKSYGNPGSEDREKLWQSIDAVHSGREILCNVASAMPHTLSVIATQKSSPIHAFPPALITEMTGDEGTMLAVEGLGRVMQRCFDQGVLCSELGDVTWARPGEVMKIAEL